MPGPSRTDRYNVSLQQEKKTYEDCATVHDLPQIFHYWSERHLRPKLLPFGLRHPNDIFKEYAGKLFGGDERREKRFAGLGAGNCDLEIETAIYLRSRGITDFSIDCVDLNGTMLERGCLSAVAAGVDSHLRFVQCDLNGWDPKHEYDAVFANQALHHIVNLEGLFQEVRRSLRPEGLFIISDMIGRNGHQRWPEAIEVVRDFWRTLPPSYRFNRKVGYYDELFEDWDCSVGGFEGVRAQDILPLLIGEFQFQLFIPFGNVIDPFIDRAFGPNFDAGAEWDKAFIDRVQERDDREIASGHLKPTHMLAVVGKDPGVSPVFPQHLSPQFCVRSPGLPDPVTKNVDSGLWEGQRWPHDSERELEIACRRLGEAGRRVRELTTSTLLLRKELAERTAWALRTERELNERTEWALRLDKELDERTAWALRLNQELVGRTMELEERTAWALKLDEDWGERTAWALGLEGELQLQTSRARLLEAELDGYVRNPLRFAVRLARGVGIRLKRVVTQGRRR